MKEVGGGGGGGGPGAREGGAPWQLHVRCPACMLQPVTAGPSHVVCLQPAPPLSHEAAGTWGRWRLGWCHPGQPCSQQPRLWSEDAYGPEQSICCCMYTHPGAAAAAPSAGLSAAGACNWTGHGLSYKAAHILLWAQGWLLLLLLQPSTSLPRPHGAQADPPRCCQARMHQHP
jgi:hypothetical protein